MKDFGQWMLDHAPPWLSDAVGELYVQFLGLVEDVNVESALQAMKASKLTAATFHHSGLRYIGEERMMPRYPSETHEEFRARLIGAWEAWKQAGTWVSLTGQLAVYGAIEADVYVQNEFGPLPTQDSGAVFDWDDDSDNWSRFVVVLRVHPWTADGDWDESPDEAWSGDEEEGTWDTDATVGEVQAVRNIITHWRPGRMVFPHVIVDFDDDFTDNLPTTGDRYDQVSNRPDEASYWDGYGVRAY